MGRSRYTIMQQIGSDANKTANATKFNCLCCKSIASTNSIYKISRNHRQDSDIKRERATVLTSCSIDDDGIRDEALREVSRKSREVNWNTIPATPPITTLGSWLMYAPNAE